MMEHAGARAVLEPYLRKVRPGSWLTRGMNQGLRTYPMIPDILLRAAMLLVRMEQIFGLTGGVRVRRVDLYQMLIDTEDELILEVPHIQGAASECGQALVRFVRTPDRRRLSLPAFIAAMTIGKRLGLLQGHGKIGLSAVVLRQIRSSVVPEVR